MSAATTYPGSLPDSCSEPDYTIDRSQCREARRQVVVDVLATALLDILLDENERAERDKNNASH